jgi:Flp pilus assembly protein TadD
LSRQYDQAIEQLNKTVEIDPENPTVHANFAVAYLEDLKYSEGIAEANQALKEDPSDPRYLAVLAYAYALEGRKVDAQQVLDKINSLPKDKYVLAQMVALVYVGMGDKDKAFEWLDKAFAEKRINDLKAFAVWDPLRSDPQFQDLLRRMNLAP